MLSFCTTTVANKKLRKNDKIPALLAGVFVDAEFSGSRFVFRLLLVL